MKIKENSDSQLSEMDIFLGMQHKRPRRSSVYIHINITTYQIILKLII